MSIIIHLDSLFYLLDKHTKDYTQEYLFQIINATNYNSMQFGMALCELQLSGLDPRLLRGISLKKSLRCWVKKSMNPPIFWQFYSGKEWIICIYLLYCE